MRRRRLRGTAAREGTNHHQKQPNSQCILNDNYREEQVTQPCQRVFLLCSTFPLKFHLFGLFPLEFPLNSQQTPTTLPTRLSNQRATSTCPVLPSSSCWASGNKPLSNQQSTRPSIKINPQPAPLPNKIPRFSFSFPQVFLAPRCTGFKKVCGINAV